MCPERVEAHAEFMFTSYQISTSLMADRQLRLLGEARQHRLARTGRHDRSTPATTDDHQAAPRLLRLPTRELRPSPAEERAAS